MFGGYYSFQGINGGARYHKTPVEEVLPVNCLPVDDRVEVPEGFAPVSNGSASHPILKGLGADWPVLLGFNEVNAEGRGRSSGDRLVGLWIRCRCSLPATTARAAPSPGHPMSGRIGCRRSSSPGTATRPCSNRCLPGRPPRIERCASMSSAMPVSIRRFASAAFPAAARR